MASVKDNTFKMVDPSKMWTPKGISAAAAVLITEKMPQLNENGQLVFDNEHKAFADVLNNRTLLADHTPLGSSASPTVANTAMKWKQFSGLNSFSKNFYEEDVKENPMTPSEYDSGIQRSLLELYKKKDGKNFNPQVILRNYNAAKEFITNQYLPALSASGSSGIGEYPYATHFFHAQSDDLSKATDIQGLANQEGHHIYTDPVKGGMASFSVSPTNINRIQYYSNGLNRGPQDNWGQPGMSTNEMMAIDYGNRYAEPPILGSPGETKDIASYNKDFSVPEIEKEEEYSFFGNTEESDGPIDTILNETVPQSGGEMFNMIMEARNKTTPGTPANALGSRPESFASKKSKESETSPVQEIIANLSAGDIRNIGNRFNVNKGTHKVPEIQNYFRGALAASNSYPSANKLVDDQKRLWGAAVPPPYDPRYANLIDYLDIGKVQAREATDTVPAMLTPGEAVIPKESAEINQPIIKALIEQGRAIQDMKGFGEPISTVPLVDDNNTELSEITVRPSGMGFAQAAEDKKNQAVPIIANNQPMNFSNAAEVRQEQEVLPIITNNQPMNFAAAAQPELVEPENEENIYTTEQLEEIREGVDEADKITKELGEQTPTGNEADFKAIVNELKDSFDSKGEVIIDKETGEEDSEATGIWSWLKDTFGFTKKDAMRGMLYYFGSRIAGYDHRPSLTFAGRRVLDEYDARLAMDWEREKFEETEEGRMVRKEMELGQKGMATTLTRLSKQFNDTQHMYTNEAGAAIREALIAGNGTLAQQLMMLDEVKTPAGRKLTKDKAKQYRLKMGSQQQPISLWEGKDGYLYKQEGVDPVTGYPEYVPVERDQYVKFGADDFMQDVRSMLKQNIDLYSQEDIDSFKKIFNMTSPRRDLQMAAEAHSRKFNKEAIETLEAINQLHELAKVNPKRFKNVKSINAALSMLGLTSLGDKDLGKLENVSGEDINDMLGKLGGPARVTNIMQHVDKLMSEENLNSYTLDKKKISDQIDELTATKGEEAGKPAYKNGPYFTIPKGIADKIKELPNPYLMLVYLEAYSNEKFKKKK